MLHQFGKELKVRGGRPRSEGDQKALTQDIIEAMHFGMSLPGLVTNYCTLKFEDFELTRRVEICVAEQSALLEKFLDCRTTYDKKIDYTWRILQCYFDFLSQLKRDPSLQYDFLVCFIPE